MRFNSNGSLDTTFNKTGMLKIETSNAVELAQAVVVQPDGKILIGGARNTGINKALLVRLNSDGTLDTSFGNNGKVTPTISPGESLITAMALLPDGKFLAGGSNKIARFTTDGNLDMSFGVSGVASSVETNQIKVSDEGKILIATRFGANAGVIRLMPNGAPDTHFNSGVKNIFLQGNTCVASSVAIQTDDKILLGGNCFNHSDFGRFAAFRLEETRTKRFLDFNGTSRTDISIYRPSNGQWWYLRGTFVPTVAGQFGTPTDLPVPADFTGDGRTDLGIFRPSTSEWLVLRTYDNSFYSFPFGTTGDIPLVADYDGDDVADAAVFRPSTNEWFIQKSTGGVAIETFGTAGDKPVPSDYDGDFKTDIAIYRPSTGVWWIKKSSDDSVYAFQFGTSTDTPVPGDYTGDNQTDAAFWRASTGEWFILRSEDSSYYSIPFGLSDDLPTPGDYSADSRYDIGIFRQSTNIWHILETGGSYYYKEFGAEGDIPLPNVFVPQK